MSPMATPISHAATSLSRSRAVITVGDVPGKTESAFMIRASGVCKPGKPIATNMSGRNIKLERAEEFGSLMVTAIAANAQFQNQNQTAQQSLASEQTQAQTTATAASEAAKAKAETDITAHQAQLDQQRQAAVTNHQQQVATATASHEAQMRQQQAQMDQQVQQLLEEGADAVCFKPFEVPKLLAALKHLTTEEPNAQGDFSDAPR